MYSYSLGCIHKYVLSQHFETVIPSLVYFKYVRTYTCCLLLVQELCLFPLITSGYRTVLEDTVYTTEHVVSTAADHVTTTATTTTTTTTTSSRWHVCSRTAHQSAAASCRPV